MNVHLHRIQTTRDPRSGFTLVEMMIVVSIVGLLATLALPSFLKPRATTRRNVCLNNLRQLDAAKQQWALMEMKGSDAEPTGPDLDDFIKGGTERVFCPADMSKTFATSYTINPVNTPPDCKIVPETHHF